MEKRILNGQIELTKYISVVVEKKGKDGSAVRGLFLPIEHNHFTEFKNKDGLNCVSANISVVVRSEPDQYGQDGFIGQGVNSKVFKAATEEEKAQFKKLPILGNIKDFSGGGSQGAGTTTISEDDDLPF